MYKTCEKMFPETCNMPYKPGIECRPGCACIDGYVREKPNGKCVLRAQCPGTYIEKLLTSKS